MTRHKAGESLLTLARFALMVELPGIEPALENALNCGNTKFNGAKVRQTTRKHLGKRVSC